MLSRCRPFGDRWGLFVRRRSRATGGQQTAMPRCSRHWWYNSSTPHRDSLSWCHWSASVSPSRCRCSWIWNWYRRSRTTYQHYNGGEPVSLFRRHRYGARPATPTICLSEPVPRQATGRWAIPSNPMCATVAYRHRAAAHRQPTITHLTPPPATRSYKCRYGL